jgi:hypothetical protein
MPTDFENYLNMLGTNVQLKVITPFENLVAKVSGKVPVQSGVFDQLTLGLGGFDGSLLKGIGQVNQSGVYDVTYTDFGGTETHIYIGDSESEANAAFNNVFTKYATAYKALMMKYQYKNWVQWMKRVKDQPVVYSSDYNAWQNANPSQKSEQAQAEAEAQAFAAKVKAANDAAAAEAARQKAAQDAATNKSTTQSQDVITVQTDIGTSGQPSGWDNFVSTMKAQAVPPMPNWGLTGIAIVTIIGVSLGVAKAKNKI